MYTFNYWNIWESDPINLVVFHQVLNIKQMMIKKDDDLELVFGKSALAQQSKLFS